MAKIGRNDPCPCGSGKKYKKCCVDKPTVVGTSSPNLSVPPEVLQNFYAHMAKQEQEEKEHVQKHGHIKQDIGVRGFHGYDFVASGNSIVFGKSWKCYSDFLIDFLPNVLEKTWCREEVSKPIEDQHPIIQFFSLAVQAKKSQKPNADGFYEATAPMAAYLNIAYHLHLVKHNGRLDSELLRRLKHPDLFQGARHELFAEATCLRANFSILHENERDGNTKHAEFVAIHKETKEKISVEANVCLQPLLDT